MNSAATFAFPAAVVAVWLPCPLLSRAVKYSPAPGAGPKVSNVVIIRRAPISLLSQANGRSPGLAEPNSQAVPVHFAGGSGKAPSSWTDGLSGQMPLSTIPTITPLPALLGPPSLLQRAGAPMKAVLRSVSRGRRSSG